jgi:hypothetical protein
MQIYNEINNMYITTYLFENKTTKQQQQMEWMADEWIVRVDSTYAILQAASVPKLRVATQVVV